jgi:hypothetical protein
VFVKQKSPQRLVQQLVPNKNYLKYFGNIFSAKKMTTAKVIPVGSMRNATTMFS